MLGSMAGTAKIGKHPIHPMLVTFPIGLWMFSFICDLVHQSGGQDLWYAMASYTMAGGIIGALLAAIAGGIDLFNLKDRAIKRIGIVHMSLNLVITVLFIINLVWRSTASTQASGPVWLSLAAIILLLISGWLGGEMVYVHGAAVEPETRR